jgi:hypothetical protein
MSNPLLKDSLARVTTAIRPQKDVIKDFVLNKTFLRGRKFTTKDHEFQDIIMEELVDPDIQFVCHKVAQAGISELIYRVMLAYCANTPGFSAALVLPSLLQTSEVMKIRMAGIIDESPTLKVLMDKKVDSAAVKKLTNGSVIYGLSGSGTSKSTTITRPIRTIIADELQYISMKTLKNMQARQRHQDHKSSIYFSSPRFKDSDIDAEIQNCGHIWQAILKCNRCNHEFFPDFYENVVVPGFSEPLITLNIKKVSDLDLNLSKSYLSCPNCERGIPHGYPHTKWINVSETPNLPKRGIKIGPFDLPRYVSPADLVGDMIRMDDRSEFGAQFLAKPIQARDNALDTTQIRFENHDAGHVNVFGLDVGKMSCLTIGSMIEGHLYIHHIEFLPLKDIRTELIKIIKEYRCLAGTIDLMPFSELAKFFIDTIPNSWACVYNNTVASAKRLELFTLKNKEDEALGNIRIINSNMTPCFDTFADGVMNGLISYKSSSMDHQVIEQLSQMSRQRDYRGGSVDDGAEITYRWMKPNNKANDHIHHSSLYCMLASKLISRSNFVGAIPPNIYSFKSKTRV